MCWNPKLMFALELSTSEDSHKQSACYKYSIIKTYHNIPLCQIFIYEHGYSFRIGVIFCVLTSCIVVLIELWAITFYAPYLDLHLHLHQIIARHLKTRPYQFLFHPDSATAMWCIQRSNSKTPHVCLYLWQTWHRHKDKIYKTVDRWAKHKVSHVYMYIGYFNYSSRFQYQNEKRVAVKTYPVCTATDRSETKSKKELYIS